MAWTQRAPSLYSKLADWQPYVVQDDFRIPSRNLASSAPAADALIKLTSTANA
ncbi:hypothetical protein ACWEQ2_38040 [Streptomyces sp. NPDC004096]|uniref:hypothetical protein n=1 Tax=unclassified Streptomyces TaxID=2593676 RepID=UPI0033A955A9